MQGQHLAAAWLWMVGARECHVREGSGSGVTSEYPVFLITRTAFLRRLMLLTLGQTFSGTTCAALEMYQQFKQARLARAGMQCRVDAFNFRKASWRSERNIPDFSGIIWQWRVVSIPGAGQRRGGRVCLKI